MLEAIAPTTFDGSTGLTPVKEGLLSDQRNAASIFVTGATRRAMDYMGDPTLDRVRNLEFVAAEELPLEGNRLSMRLPGAKRAKIDYKMQITEKNTMDATIEATYLEDEDTGKYQVLFEKYETTN